MIKLSREVVMCRLLTRKHVAQFENTTTYGTSLRQITQKYFEAMILEVSNMRARSVDKLCQTGWGSVLHSTSSATNIMKPRNSFNDNRLIQYHCCHLPSAKPRSPFRKVGCQLINDPSTARLMEFLSEHSQLSWTRGIWWITSKMGNEKMSDMSME
jgi:hypothetical protein